MQCDLHQSYGIDLGDDDLLRRRRWPWLRGRILGLLTEDTRIARVLIPREAPGGA